MSNEVDILAGQVRLVERNLTDLTGRVLAHEAVHEGAKLPDIVGWAGRQWLAMPSPLRLYVYVYALGFLVAMLRWLWQQLTRPPKPSGSLSPPASRGGWGQ